MRTALGVLTIVVGFIAAVYVGIGRVLIGGINNIGNGFKGAGTHGGQVLWGFIELPLGLIIWFLILAAFVGFSIPIFGGGMPKWLKKLTGRNRDKGSRGPVVQRGPQL